MAWVSSVLPSPRAPYAEALHTPEEAGAGPAGEMLVDCEGAELGGKEALVGWEGAESVEKEALVGCEGAELVGKEALVGCSRTVGSVAFVGWAACVAWTDQGVMDNRTDARAGARGLSVK